MSKQVMSLRLGGNPIMYDSVTDFGLSTFKLKINEKGIITVNGEPQKISYNMKEYSKKEALNDFCKSSIFKSFYQKTFINYT